MIPILSRIIYCVCLCTIVSSTAICQTREFRINAGLGILWNARDVKSTSDKSYLQVKNTLQPSTGFLYTLAFPGGLLLSSGGSVGYEQYRTYVSFPFETYGFKQPDAPGIQYSINSIIPYGQVNVNVGYRFTNLEKLQPEIRIGQVLNFPLGSRNLEITSRETPLHNRNEQTNFVQYGWFGKPGGGSLTGELLNFVYLGINKTDSSNRRTYTAGVKLQSQLFMSSINSMSVRYYNSSAVALQQDRFSGRHTTVSIVFGMSL